MFICPGGKDGEEHDVDNWMLVGEKLNAEERLSEDVKKVLGCLRIVY